MRTYIYVRSYITEMFLLFFFTDSVSVYMFMCVCAQSCLTLCDPMYCNPPGASVYGILQARILEWVAMPSSRGSP